MKNQNNRVKELSNIMKESIEISEYLTFEKIDEDEYVAKTPVFHYEIWVLKNYCRAVITMNPNLSESKGIIKELGKRRGMKFNEAKLACNTHYMELMNDMNNQLLSALNKQSQSSYSLCSKCKETPNNINPEPCCTFGHCEAPEKSKGITNCIHCGAELIEKNGCWYHYSQFDAEELGEPQDTVE